MSVVFTEERNKLIGTNIRTYRQLNGLTQEELASGICSVSQLSKIENGQTYAQRSILKNLAERMGVSVEKLESENGLRDELCEQLQLAKHALVIQKYEQSLEIVHEVISKCCESAYHDELLDAQILKVELLRHMKDYKASVEVANSVLESTTIKNRAKYVHLLCQQGHSHYEIGDISLALDCYSRAHDEIGAVELEDDVMFRVYYDLSHINVTVKNYRTALRLAEKASILAQQQSKHLHCLRATYIQAIATKFLGDFRKAENLYLNALKIAKDNSWLVDEGIICNNLGCLYKDEGQLGDSKQYLKRSLGIYEILKEQKRMLDTQIQMAEIEYLQKNYTRVNEMIDIILSTADKIEEKNVFLERGKAYKLASLNKLAVDDFDGFISYAEIALKIYADHQLFVDAYEVAFQLATELDERQDARALGVFRQALYFNEQSISIGLRR